MTGNHCACILKGKRLLERTIAGSTLSLAALQSFFLTYILSNNIQGSCLWHFSILTNPRAEKWSPGVCISFTMSEASIYLALCPSPMGSLVFFSSSSLLFVFPESFSGSDCICLLSQRSQSLIRLCRKVSTMVILFKMFNSTNWIPARIC